MIARLTGVVEDGTTPSPAVPIERHQELHVRRGEIVTLKLALFGRNGAPLRAGDYTLTLWVKRSSRSEDAVITKTFAATPLEGENTSDVSIGLDDFREVPPGRYVFDVWLSRWSGDPPVLVQRDVLVPLSPFIVEAGLAPLS